MQEPRNDFRFQCVGCASGRFGNADRQSTTRPILTDKQHPFAAMAT